MTVYRCFVEKRKEFAVEAAGVKADLTEALRSDVIESVRVLNRYDIEDIDQEDYLSARYTILSEPQVDDLYEENAPEPAEDEWVFAVEYLPGQFNQYSASVPFPVSTKDSAPSTNSISMARIVAVFDFASH